ncbi:porin family protein [Nordella sp. HKS 07]|uniref:outer membrane protein n=1 Tax=Nordella sp. HKS 07 TaxID=2712222 RepID=UPI0013E1D60E|nr:outer membrane protein [Nordella sp. HKS 07]QIG48732.1 porin family protein [Nordella sp. HKS 07]
MRRLLLVAGLIVGLSGVSLAADVVEPMPAAYDWTGVYVGGQVGWQWFEGDISDPATNRFGSVDDDDFVYGGHIGANYQIDSIVLGIEGDIEGTNISASSSEPDLIDVAAEADIDLQGSIRARLGWAIDNILIYATGGYAWADADFDYKFPSIGGVTSSFSETLDGWTVGGGLEWGWDQWSTRIEYRYTEYDDESGDITECCAPPPSEQLWDDMSTQSLRLGITYRFFAH